MQRAIRFEGTTKLQSRLEVPNYPCTISSRFTVTTFGLQPYIGGRHTWIQRHGIEMASFVFVHVQCNILRNPEKHLGKTDSVLLVSELHSSLVVFLEAFCRFLTSSKCNSNALKCTLSFAYWKMDQSEIEVRVREHSIDLTKILKKNTIIDKIKLRLPR